MNMEEYFVLLGQVRSVNLVSIDEMQKFSMTDKRSLFDLLQKKTDSFWKYVC